MNNETTSPEVMLDNSLKEVINLIKNKNYTKAKEILNNYLNYSLTMTEETEDTRYFSFRDSLEFYSAVRILSMNKKAVWTKFKNSYVYNLLAYIANEEHEYEKAIDYSKKALGYNPLDSNLYFELSETYKFLKDFENMRKLTLDSYNILFDSKELARFYRNLGFYYTEVGKYDLAFALYVVSLNFDVDPTAYHEIGFIRNKQGNDKYKLSTKEVLELLSKEGIPYGIRNENRIILKQFIETANVPDTLHETITEAKAMLSKTNIPMLDVDYLLSIPVMPKIISSDMFDEKKNELTDLDKEIQEKNKEIVKAMNIPYSEKLLGIPINSVTVLKSKEEILSSMLKDYVIATLCVYSLENQKELIPVALNGLDIKLGVRKYLSNEDLKFINMIASGNVQNNRLQSLTWLYERVYVYMWCLGLVEKPNPTKECNSEEMDKFFIGINNPEDLLSKLNPKSKEEILEYADLIYRYNYACIESNLKKIPLTALNVGAVKEHKSALDYVLGFKMESLMNEYITIKYEKNDFNFSVEVPNKIYIKEVVNLKKPTNMLSFVNNNETTIITFIDRGVSTKEEFNKKYIEDLNDYKNFGWSIISQKEFMRGEQEIKEVYLNVTLNRKDKPEFGIVKYYFLLNGHLMCIESLLERDFDYKNIVNTLNTKTAFDMVISIKETTN